MLPDVGFRDLYDAYLACRRHKRGTHNALHFESHLIDHLFDLRDALRSGSYRPGRSVAFLAKDPKLREIFAADFKDRVVHHYLVPKLEAHYEPRFIHDVHSNRRGRGIHSAASRLQGFMRSAGHDAWALQCDIRNFFYSIDKTLLLRILHLDLAHGTVAQREGLLWLANRILTHDVREGVHVRGDLRRFAALPEHKSLLKLPRHLGLPIGNLTSQFFANVYLNAFDHFVKRRLRVKGYVRYVDDFVLVDQERAVLERHYTAMADFLRTQRSLTLKPPKLVRVGEGVDVLGYVIRPHYRLVRRRVVNTYKRKKARYLDAYEAQQGKMTLAEIKAFLSVQASFKAHAKHVP